MYLSSIVGRLRIAPIPDQEGGVRSQRRIERKSIQCANRVTFHLSTVGAERWLVGNRADFGVSVVRADVIGAFAKPRGLKPVWIVWVEKDGGKGSDGLAEDHGLFSRKDFIGFYYQDDNGWHGHLMRFRD